MKDFAGKIAVITGGGTGMGRELARQLVAEGCNVAMCDVSAEAMAETKRLCEVEKLPQGLRVTTHIADVSIEDQLKRFRDELAEQQSTDRIHLLFNNAGIGGGGSLFTSTREQWERTFNICWGGVYFGVRTFLPMLVTEDDVQALADERARSFQDDAPTTAAAAAKIILDGVKAERWRILVGDDAHRLDQRVREAPEQAYDAEFFQSFAAEVGWRLG